MAGERIAGVTHEVLVRPNARTWCPDALTLLIQVNVLTAAMAIGADHRRQIGQESRASDLGIDGQADGKPGAVGRRDVSVKGLSDHELFAIMMLSNFRRLEAAVV